MKKLIVIIIILLMIFVGMYISKQNKIASNHNTEVSVDEINKSNIEAEKKKKEIRPCLNLKM